MGAACCVLPSLRPRRNYVVPPDGGGADLWPCQLKVNPFPLDKREGVADLIGTSWVSARMAPQMGNDMSCWRAAIAMAARWPPDGSPRRGPLDGSGVLRSRVADPSSRPRSTKCGQDVEPRPVASCCPDVRSTNNHILSALEVRDSALLTSCLGRVDLEARAVLFEPGDIVDRVYFPSSAIIADQIVDGRGGQRPRQSFAITALSAWDPAFPAARR